jgi:hypothetical protein
LIQGSLRTKTPGPDNLIRNKIRKIFSLAALFLLIVFVISCAQKSHIHTGSSFTPEGWNKIVVFPFTGTRGSTYLATEAFTFHIKAKEHFEIIEPKTSYATINTLGIQYEDNVITIEDAKKVAEQLHAQALIMGNIDVLKKGRSFDAVTTVKVIDVNTGRTVTESTRSSGLKVKNSEEQCVIISVGNTSVDINEFLVGAAGKNIPAKEVKPADKNTKVKRDLKQKN